MPPLHVIPGTPAPDTPAERVRKRMRAMPKPAAILQCPRCAGREVMETRIGVALVGGKPRGGTRQWLCVGCLGRGERMVVA
jgi:hypothetical protein